MPHALRERDTFMAMNPKGTGVRQGFPEEANIEREALKPEE